ncbi:hypothetical protein QQ045_013361 [Rhodiola kirilowii]
MGEPEVYLQHTGELETGEFESEIYRGICEAESCQRTCRQYENAIHGRCISLSRVRCHCFKDDYNLFESTTYDGKLCETKRCRRTCLSEDCYTGKCLESNESAYTKENPYLFVDEWSTSTYLRLTRLAKRQQCSQADPETNQVEEVRLQYSYPDSHFLFHRIKAQVVVGEPEVYDLQRNGHELETGEFESVTFRGNSRCVHEMCQSVCIELEEAINGFCKDVHRERCHCGVRHHNIISKTYADKSCETQKCIRTCKREDPNYSGKCIVSHEPTCICVKDLESI